MKLAVNALIAWREDRAAAVHALDRIIHITPDGETIVTCRVLELAETGGAGPPAMVEVRRFAIEHLAQPELEAALACGQARQERKDPWAWLVMSEEDLRRWKGSGYAWNRDQRDYAWRALDAFFRRAATLAREGAGGDLYDPRQRGPLIDAFSAEHGVGATSLRKWLRCWWQRGMVPGALLPTQFNSGAPGHPKADRGRKVGRPRDPKTQEPTGIGSNLATLARDLDLLTEDSTRYAADDPTTVGDLCRKGLDDFYLNLDQLTLPQARQETLERYCTVAKAPTKVGGKDTALAPPTARPSIGQFRKAWNAYRATLDPAYIVKCREGKHAQDTKYRPTTEDTLRAAPWPMAILQLDSWRADIPLCHPLNRLWLIGPPLVYLLIDVFSRLICGVAVMLEGPSWRGAMTALANVFEDKREYCARFGIALGPDDWPVHHRPEWILTDRGSDYMGYSSDQIAPLRIQFSNLPALRPDYKPVVEGKFRLIKDDLLIRLPGKLDKRQPGDPDPQLAAALTPREFTEALLRWIVNYNAKHALRGYRRADDARRDGVKPRPLDLFRWGVANRSGTLLELDPRIVRRNLLPRDRASLTRHGIRFKGVMFESALARRDHWMQTGKSPGWDGTVSCDDRLTDRIYLHMGRDDVEVAWLMPKKDDGYTGWSWPETLLAMADDDEQTLAAEVEQEQADAELADSLRGIVAPAQRATNKVTKQAGPRDRTRGKGEHRREAAELDGAQAAEQFAPVSGDNPLNAPPAAPPPLTLPPPPSRSTTESAGPAKISGFEEALKRRLARGGGTDAG